MRATQTSAPPSVDIKPQTTTNDQVLNVQVVKVHDGDTFSVNIRDWPPIVGLNMPIRIHGIDTPEMNSIDAKLKSLAIQARDYVKNRINTAKKIELRNITRDKYFRLDADVYIDNTNIASELIAKGLAKPYTGGTKNPWHAN